MFESVLVPLDGSQLAEAALAPVEEIARTAGSRVFLLHVIRPIERQVEESLPFVSVSSQPQDLRELLLRQQFEHEAAARVYLNSTRERLAAKGIKVEAQVDTAEVTDSILRHAREANATAIVMTSHGRGSREYRLYGGVAGEVLRRSPIPVLLVHPPARSK